jgi:alkanesulfonate monooxygenase SsuD/methylene tetrahydromethanopterin reductase-like flavin-dependent oxidoreductase (luciferase family)
MSDLIVGMTPPDDLWRGSGSDRRQIASALADAGVDHFFLADHVSFHDGSGTDALVAMAGLAQLDDRLSVMAGVYLLALRHPVTVARQLATLSEQASGRVIFGVGVGGEDRHEMEVCGVDPSTRGKRTDEYLEVLRPLLRGESVSFDGEFVSVVDALIRPIPRHEIPVVVGGRSNAALRRTGRYGDGWLGSWCSTRRFTEAVAIVDDVAAEAGRSDVGWRHGVQFWVGVGDNEEEGAALAKQRMESFYKLPFAAFAKYTPVGTPAQIASDLTEYRDAGCSLFNITPCAGSASAALEAMGEIKRALVS